MEVSGGERYRVSFGGVRMGSRKGADGPPRIEEPFDPVRKGQRQVQHDPIGAGRDIDVVRLDLRR
jgi:hypothetical protein